MEASEVKYSTNTWLNSIRILKWVCVGTLRQDTNGEVPHDLATRDACQFHNLAFEGCADLTLVQDVACQKDLRIMRHYQQRRESLRKNAVDFIWI